jgi:predicted metal-dependent phosphoesterase TrpH
VIDLHLHTTASDGRLAPPDLVSLAAACGLTIISVTDHDTVAGLADAAAAAAAAGVRLIPGIEITAVEQTRDVHVLGYFFDPENPALGAFLQTQRIDRVRRVREMGRRLHSLGFTLDIDRMLTDAAAQNRCIGRPQIADALAAAGHVRDRRDGFDRLLGAGRPAFVPRQGPSVRDVVGVVAAAGGIGSLAHPGLLDMDDAIPAFARSGLTALEARHSDHDAVTEARYRKMAGDLGLAVSGGSDFHADPSQHINALGVVTLSPAEFAALELRAIRHEHAASPFPELKTRI